MNLIERILPREANNNYEGSRIAFYGFVLVTVVMTFRSLVHLLFEDAGLNSIGNMVIFEAGEPDPNQALYLFGSLWGLQQLLMCVVQVVVIIRYRSLTSLMLLLLLLEWVARPVLIGGLLHPLGEAYFESPAPGAVGAWPSVIFLSALLLFSLRRPAEREATAS